MTTQNIFSRYASASFILIFFAVAAHAQTTAFTYQGRLTDNNAAANGNYDFRFQLYNTALNFPTGSPVEISGVAVTGGTFTVNLDFSGSVQFRQTPNNKLSLEIAVRPAGSSDPYTTLAPRQPLNAAPFSISALIAENAFNAQYAGVANFASTCQTANSLSNGGSANFVQSNDFRLTNDRNPTAGSSNYIQNNGTTTAQTGDFNLSGNGTLGGSFTVQGAISGGLFKAATQYNIGDYRVLGIAGNLNLFVGINAGAVNTGEQNTFVGQTAGLNNIGGDNNSFFGSIAGRDNQTGDENSYFGTAAGASNTTGKRNSFFGTFAGAGYLGGTDYTGSYNSFFGNQSGAGNSTGSSNSFFGIRSGLLNTTGAHNTLLGSESDVSENNLTYATAIGADSIVSANNTIAFGRPDGSDKVVIYGLGVAGDTSLCRNGLNQISTCTAGNFAENSKAFNTLREQNAQMLEQLKQQQSVIDELSQIVCALKPDAAICQ